MTFQPKPLAERKAFLASLKEDDIVTAVSEDGKKRIVRRMTSCRGGLCFGYNSLGVGKYQGAVGLSEGYYGARRYWYWLEAPTDRDRESLLRREDAAEIYGILRKIDSTFNERLYRLSSKDFFALLSLAKKLNEVKL